MVGIDQVDVVTESHLVRNRNFSWLSDDVNGGLDLRAREVSQGDGMTKQKDREVSKDHSLVTVRSEARLKEREGVQIVVLR